MLRNAFIEHKESCGRKKKISGLIEKAFLSDCSGIGGGMLNPVNAGYESPRPRPSC